MERRARVYRFCFGCYVVVVVAAAGVGGSGGVDVVGGWCRLALENTTKGGRMRSFQVTDSLAIDSD